MSQKSIKLVVDRLVEHFYEPPSPKFKQTDSKSEVDRIIRNTALQTSSVSAALSIPGGISGLITVLPEIASVWKMQAQMISNIAAINGKDHLLTREQMLWCMFRQMGYGVLKEYVIQQGGVYLIRQMKSKAFEGTLKKLGVSIAGRQGSRLAGKIIPVVGSLSAGALTYYDTRKVGRNANNLYSAEIQLLN